MLLAHGTLHYTLCITHYTLCITLVDRRTPTIKVAPPCEEGRNGAYPDNP